MAERLRVLVVDDSPVVLKAYHRALDDEYELIEADDGEVAWDILNQDDDICAVFADSDMNHLNGQALLKKLRTSENNDIKSLPFILVATEHDDYESKQEAMEAGVTDFISKPFDTKFLKACAQNHVRPNEKNLRYQRNSIIDPLTKLANKAYFFTRGVQEIAAATRHKISLALIVVNIDGFEELMEKRGEKITKGVLRKIGSYIASEVRLEDTVARIDQGQFGILTSRTELPGVEVIAERVRSKVNKKIIRYGETSFEVATSIGAAVMLPNAYMDFDVLYQSAVDNLQQAIQSGGDRLVARSYGEVDVQNQNVEYKFTLDQVANMVNLHDLEKINGQEALILERILPIFIYCDSALGLGGGEQIEKIRQYLKQG